MRISDWSSDVCSSDLIEGLPFLEAIRQLGNELGRERSLFLHVTLIPYIAAAGELKTKPTQHSVKELQSMGIKPDILVCRAEREIPKDERRKTALFWHVREEAGKIGRASCRERGGKAV